MSVWIVSQECDGLFTVITDHAETTELCTLTQNGAPSCRMYASLHRLSDVSPLSIPDQTIRGENGVLEQLSDNVISGSSRAYKSGRSILPFDAGRSCTNRREKMLNNATLLIEPRARQAHELAAKRAQ